MQEYADPVIDWLDAGQGILGRRFFREVCATSPIRLFSAESGLLPHLSDIVLYPAAKRVIQQGSRTR